MRVNNREYQTETEYETEDLAQNAAAARAYMICRNFSVNDGVAARRPPNPPSRTIARTVLAVTFPPVPSSRRAA